MKKTVTTKQRILETAARLFGAHGKNGVSTADIAREANANKALIFYYFTSKEGLYIEVFRHWMELFSARINSSFADSEPGLSMVESFVRDHVGFLDEHRDMMRVLIREMLSSHEEISPVIEHSAAVLKPIRNNLLIALSAARKKGDIRDVDPIQTVVNIISLDIFFFLGFPLLNIINPSINTPEFRRARIDSVLDLIMNGLRKQPEAEE